ncbi:S8 family peptidase [Bacillus tianshenii]|nr:S8 family peptidase [Bacillus tianshenii]
MKVLSLLLAFQLAVGNTGDTPAPTHTNTYELPQMEHWGLKVSKIKEAHERGYSGKGVKIAVVDTGIDRSHPDIDLSGGASFVDYTADYQDDQGHGTYVAGLIAANHNDIGVLGIAPDAEIYGLKANDSQRKGPIANFVNAVNWAIEHNMDIIHFSWSTDEYSSELEAALKRAYKHNILIVGSAGNTQSGVRYPAKFPYVIAVSAIAPNLQKAGFSNFGPEIEFTAPGTGMYSLNTNQSYARTSGTSLAAPHVTGILALMKEAYPEKTNMELRAMLQAHAKDIGEEGRDDLYGYGIVQAPLAILPKKAPLQRSKPVRQIEVFDWNMKQHYGKKLTVVAQNKDEYTVLPPGYTKPIKMKPNNITFTSVQVVELSKKQTIYDKPNGRAIAAIGPQKLSAFQKKGDWYEVETWIGKKWIKLS